MKNDHINDAVALDDSQLDKVSGGVKQVTVNENLEQQAINKVTSATCYLCNVHLEFIGATPDGNRTHLNATGRCPVCKQTFTYVLDAANGKVSSTGY